MDPGPVDRALALAVYVEHAPHVAAFHRAVGEHTDQIARDAHARIEHAPEVRELAEAIAARDRVSEELSPNESPDLRTRFEAQAQRERVARAAREVKLAESLGTVLADRRAELDRRRTALRERSLALVAESLQIEALEKALGAHAAQKESE